MIGKFTLFLHLKMLVEMLSIPKQYFSHIKIMLAGKLLFNRQILLIQKKLEHFTTKLALIKHNFILCMSILHFKWLSQNVFSKLMKAFT